jgi:hypothetical protein
VSNIYQSKTTDTSIPSPWSRGPPRTPPWSVTCSSACASVAWTPRARSWRCWTGAKALSKAVREVFDKPIIQRCQEHKIRNVRDRPPDKLRSLVARRMRDANHADSALAAEAKLTALAKELDKTHPGAAASLREGLQETPTVRQFGVPPTLARTLRSTNPIESMISICRSHATNVKRWRDGRLALRWCAAGMVEAATQFRRVNGHLHLPKLRDALGRHFAKLSHRYARIRSRTRPDDHRAATKFHGTRDIVEQSPV